VDSRGCDSKGGCCDSRRGLCSTPFPCQERAALAIGQGQGQQCAARRTSVRLLPAAGATHSQCWDGEARCDGFGKSGLCTGEAVRRLRLSGQGLLVLSPDTIVRPPGPLKEPGHACRLQLRAKEGQRLTFRALSLPSLMVCHVKLHGHGEGQRERDHAEISHLNEFFFLFGVISISTTRPPRRPGPGSRVTFFSYYSAVCAHAQPCATIPGPGRAFTTLPLASCVWCQGYIILVKCRIRMYVERPAP